MAIAWILLLKLVIVSIQYIAEFISIFFDFATLFRFDIRGKTNRLTNKLKLKSDLFT